MRKFPFRCPFLLLIVLAGVSTGCDDTRIETEFVARVGEVYLTESTISDAIGGVVSAADSMQARERFIEQWISNQVMRQEALRRGLDRDPHVVSQLQASERSILVNALLEKLYEEEEPGISRADLESYYDQHRSQLVLTEPYIKIHYITADSPDSIEVVIGRMESAASAADPDSAWSGLTASLPPGMVNESDVSSAYLPKSQVTSSIPGLEELIDSASAGEVLPPFSSEGRIHLVQLVERLEAGTLPELDMIEEFLLTRVRIEARKQMLARQVQRLRNEAIAREELEFR